MANLMKSSISWKQQKERTKSEFHSRFYVVFAADAWSDHAMRLQDLNPEKFKYFPIKWDKYPDGTDDITISGFLPKNEIVGEHILFFASFHNNDVTLSQMSVLIVLLQSFIASMTIVLPFFPVGTNERVDKEGKVATANTYAILLSNLPPSGPPNRLLIYDIHALQNRFYFHNATIPSLHTTVPLLLEKLGSGSSQHSIAFPDDGAAKRFGGMFKSLGFDIIVCGKVRNGATRIVRIQDGNPDGKDVVIVDDLVQTGGTLYECALALRAMGARQVNAFVAHAVFPNSCWKAFCKNPVPGAKAVFDRFWVTNSVPSVVKDIPTDDVFEVLDLLPRIITDLDMS